MNLFLRARKSINNNIFKIEINYLFIGPIVQWLRQLVYTEQTAVRFCLGPLREKMKYLRATLVGALYWLLVFVVIAFFILKFNLTDTLNLILVYTIMIPLAVICSWLYYKTGDKTNGLFVCFFIFLISIVLDLLIKIPLVGIFTYKYYYLNYRVWIGILESILVFWLYYLFAIKRTKKKENKLIKNFKENSKKK